MELRRFPITSKRKQDQADLGEDSPSKLARYDNSSRIVPAGTAGRDALHALPAELLAMIFDRVIPESPYLARPCGENSGYFTVAPTMRVLENWGATCTAARRLIAAVRKDPSRAAFCALASRVTFEALGQTPLARVTAIEQYGVDPEATRRAMKLEAYDPADLARHSNSLRKRASNLERVELNLYLESSADWGTLAKALELCTNLAILSLRSNASFPMSLLHALSSMPALRTLELNGPALPVDLFAQLRNLPVWEQLESLSITATDRSLTQLQSPASSAGKQSALRFLTFKGGCLGAGALTSLAEFCSKLTHLKSLQVGAHEGLINGNAASGMLKALAEHSCVTRLNLCQIGGDEIDGSLFSALGLFSKLHELRLSRPLQSGEVEQLRRMLADPNLYLQALDLECAELDDAGVMALADAVRECPWLHELRLAHINFSDAGVEALARAISTNRGLLKLSLSECDIKSKVDGLKLSNALAVSTTLREVHLQIALPQDCNNEITYQLADLFSCAAEDSLTLLHMTIRGFHGGEFSNLVSHQAEAKLAQNRRRLDPG